MGNSFSVAQVLSCEGSSTSLRMSRTLSDDTASLRFLCSFWVPEPLSHQRANSNLSNRSTEFITLRCREPPAPSSFRNSVSTPSTAAAAGLEFRKATNSEYRACGLRGCFPREVKRLRAASTLSSWTESPRIASLRQSKLLASWAIWKCSTLKRESSSLSSFRAKVPRCWSVAGSPRAKQLGSRARRVAGSFRTLATRWLYASLNLR
mmetsp:Transcript_40896/g.63842  ORF Transcript_40896/g.63842 Transcript_40896/m.63842 type:complete len:207 (+) Transcript_40896:186-806(+)